MCKYKTDCHVKLRQAGKRWTQKQNLNRKEELKVAALLLEKIVQKTRHTDIGHGTVKIKTGNDMTQHKEHKGATETNLHARKSQNCRRITKKHEK